MLAIQYLAIDLVSFKRVVRKVTETVHADQIESINDVIKHTFAFI